LFIALNNVAAVVYWIWLPETNQLSLEEVAGAFGDVVMVGDGAGEKGEGDDVVKMVDWAAEKGTAV
jgi:hypothetical protein